MADAGTRYTDAAQAELERRFRAIYREAQEDIIKKLDAHTKRLNALDKIKRAQVEAGTLSQEEYRNWLNGQVFIGKQWKDKVDSVATSLLYANRQANDIVEGKKRAVFGENATYQAYSLEHDAGMDLSFGIYDSDTVTRLIKEQPELLPRKVVNGVKDKAWNRTKIANAVTQGIIQGEGIPEIAKRIARQVGSDNMEAMTRYARTAMTGAQNAGRVEMLHEAQAMGIKVKKKWLATLDSRTRDAHANLDGQTAEVDEPFKSDLGPIMFPGDFSAHPANTWNCRCTMIYEYPEYMPQNAQRRAYNEDRTESELISDMTYKEWKAWKSGSTQSAAPVQPQKNILDRDAFDGGDSLIEKERQQKADNERRRKELDEEYSSLRREMRSVRRELSDLDGDNSEAARLRRAELEKRLDEINARKEAIPLEYGELSKNETSYNSAHLVDRAEQYGVEYKIPTKNEVPLSDDEIISRIAGGDMTEGSCASVSMCYVGQKEGYNVYDFRDGGSRTIISQDARQIIRGISAETGYQAINGTVGTGTLPAKSLVELCEPGKEYYFIAGRHASIVRVDTEKGFEYLELQSGLVNGWKKPPKGADGKTDYDTFFSVRFGCDNAINDNPVMIETKGMYGSNLFHRALGYINTDETAQVKGELGFAK